MGRGEKKSEAGLTSEIIVCVVVGGEDGWRWWGCWGWDWAKRRLSWWLSIGHSSVGHCV